VRLFNSRLNLKIFKLAVIRTKRILMRIMFKLTTKWYCIINKQYSQRKEEQIAHKYARFLQGLHESSSQNQSIIYIPCPTRCTTDYLNPWISPVVHRILAGLCSAPLLWKAEICFLWEFRAKFKASEVWRRFAHSSLYFKAVHVRLEVNLTLWRDALIESWNFLS
jgi:hypothetical protein